MASSSSTTPSSTSTTSSLPKSRVFVPKVWKRPHSTIYGKNVEFGNSLYSDKIGEIDSRKFNVTDPQWSSMRSTSGGTSPTWSSFTTDSLANDSTGSARKLSLSSINPHSYRPRANLDSNNDEIDLHDRSSPFYTDRWAGKTIRHFDSDLYSNANLFKSMIL
ncbi:hypothetical protein GZH46_01243 [Fragariocoptes setiger]|uniref:Uncharacterized protein n=1 Tax=Fragariocoptes setiger TaxID=1670756 RepID=A0ABQ7SA27_9ACAR|nr:hypothetical protein GZH46_01243 [Fragariocoptes setiger]